MEFEILSGLLQGSRGSTPESTAHRTMATSPTTETPARVSKTSQPLGVFNKTFLDLLKGEWDTFRRSEEVLHTSGETSYFSTFSNPGQGDDGCGVTGLDGPLDGTRRGHHRPGLVVGRGRGERSRLQLLFS